MDRRQASYTYRNDIIYVSRRLVLQSIGLVRNDNSRYMCEILEREARDRRGGRRGYLLLMLASFSFSAEHLSFKFAESLSSLGWK